MRICRSAEACVHKRLPPDVWSAEQTDLKNWNRPFQEHYTVVAVDDKIIEQRGDFRLPFQIMVADALFSKFFVKVTE